MPKNKARAKIDSEYNKDLRYPDINDYLKDTYYSANTSNYADNQSRTLLVLRQQDAKLDLITPTIAGAARRYLLNSFVFYGYNPELESVSHCVLKVEYLDDSVIYSKTYRRDNNETALDPDRLQVIPGGARDVSLGRVVNFGIFMSKMTMSRILEAIFNKNQRLASEYYLPDLNPDDEESSDGRPVFNPLRLRNFVDAQLYRLKIPLTIEVFYYDSEEAAAIIETELSFGSIVSSLLAQIRPREVSVRLNNYTTPQYKSGNYFKVSGNPTVPVQITLRSRIDNSVTVINEVSLSKEKPNADLSLSAHIYAKESHFNYRVTYPKLDFALTGYRVGNTNALIRSFFDIADITFGKANDSKSLRILDYFIGHTPIYYTGHSSEGAEVYKKDPLKIRIKFSIDSSFNHTIPYKFQLEFHDSATPATQYLLIAGDVNTTLPTTEQYATKTSGSFSFAYKAGTSADSRTVKLVSVRAKDATSAILESISHRFNVTLKKVDSTVYELQVTWPNSATDVRGLTLAAELPRITLKIADYFQQPLFTGTVLKKFEDVYAVRSSNPFFVNDSSQLTWYPRYRDLLINGKTLKPVGSFVNLARVPNLSTYAGTAAPITYYRLSSPTGAINLRYTVRLYCRGYSSPNNQRSYFMPDVFFPLTSLVIASYKQGNTIKYGTVASSNRFLNRLDATVGYTFNTSTNQVEISIPKTKVMQWIRLLIGNPEKVTTRQFYLLVNTTTTNPFTNRYASDKPVVSVVMMYEV
jgi:hypothetical protein